MKNKDIPEGGALTCLRCRGLPRATAYGFVGLAARQGNHYSAQPTVLCSDGLGAKGVCMIDTIGMNANQKNFTVGPLGAQYQQQ